jgi:PAS domain S-box-containing protein
MENTADEIKRLQSCINDLISVLALPAIWIGSESSQIVGTLLDALLAMLRLDFAYARLSDSNDGPPIEVVRLGHRQHPSAQLQVGQALSRWLTGDPAAPRFVLPDPAGEGEVSIASFSLGLQDEIGVLLAGSRRADFPTEVERLLLRVAANQAGIGLQEARRSDEQKRIAEMLEQRVAERTTELTRANENLKLEIAERKRAEAQLRESEEQWRDVFENNPTMYFMVDAVGKVMAVNPFGAEQLGYNVDELIGQPVLSVSCEPDREAVQRNVAVCLEQLGRTKSWEVRKVRKDGTVLRVRETAKAVPRVNGPIVLIACEDITEQKRAEEALRQAQADLARVSEVTTMAELSASLAHEVNQPIAAAVTNANTCLRWLAGDTPNIEEARAAAMRIVKDGTRAAEIISRTRLLFKKGTPQRALVDVNEVIREMIVLLRSEAARYSISVRAELAADPPQVMGDRVQLQQVFMNLMLNGIDAMKDMNAGGELTIKSRQAENGQLLISVSDTGVGLPPQQADQIFNPFFTTKPHGTGMGLSISRSIVESHGGRLWAADNSPRGASFYFTLPSKVEAHE